MEPRLAYFDRPPAIADGYATVGSLHSRTLFSRESALPLGRLLDASVVPRLLIRTAHRRFGANTIDEDLSRIWWTPPLTPRQALDVEARQIEDTLGLDPIVSISDHDSIDAPMQLQVLGKADSLPVSVEWTVPYRATYVHVGLHSIDPHSAAARMAEMGEFTARPDRDDLPEMLAAYDSDPGCLVVFNHPFWDQPMIGRDRHRILLEDFIDSCRPWIHALEMNGLCNWRENERALALSRTHGIPLVSGGDRHGLEPNATLNLTSASSFGGFAEEVRSGHSQIVMMPRYRRPLALRIIENFTDIVSDDPNHGLGWTTWTERVFRRCDDGEVRSLHAILGSKPPIALRAVAFAFRALSNRFVKPALEWAMPRTRELG